jgi:hypothetical protein
MESPLDPNFQTSYIPQGYEHNILDEIIKDEIRNVISKNHGLLKKTGERFWIGTVNVLDGEIEEVHTYEEAERNDFHHSLYFSQSQIDKIDNEECMVFWINSGGVQGEWTHGVVARSIVGKIKQQIEIV